MKKITISRQFQLFSIRLSAPRHPLHRGRNFSPQYSPNLHERLRCEDGRVPSRRERTKRRSPDPPIQKMLQFVGQPGYANSRHKSRNQTDAARQPSRQDC